MSKPQVGIQLYSLRDRSEKDFFATIREVAEIGYKNVEFAGYYGKSAKEIRALLDEVGLNAPSAHVGLGIQDKNATPNWDELKNQVAFGQEIGLTKFVVPWYPLGDNPTASDVDRMGENLRQAGEIVNAAGLAFGYHNHAFEFKAIEGQSELIIDRLFSRIPANLIFAEFDLGWVKVAGQDPAEYVKKYAGRLPLVHAKDFKADGSDAEIGQGTVDWDSALAACEATGVEYVIIEQEGYPVNSLESAKNNYNWFKERGWI